MSTDRRENEQLDDVAMLWGSVGGGHLPFPVAAFTGTPLTGGDPTDVTFTNTSTNTTEYLWEKRLLPGSWGSFDGDSAAANPVETFTGIGTWDVRLTATNARGTNTLTRTSYVSITS